MNHPLHFYVLIEEGLPLVVGKSAGEQSPTMRPLEYLLGEPELVPVCRDLSKLLKLNQLFWAGLCRALGWPEPDPVFQGNHQTLMALKHQNIEPIFYFTPNIPQYPVCDFTTGFTLSFQVNFPVFPWLCCLWFRTKNCAEGFRSLHLLDMIWHRWEPTQLYCPTASCSDWTKLLGILFSPLA